MVGGKEVEEKENNYKSTSAVGSYSKELANKLGTTVKIISANTKQVQQLGLGPK